MLTARMRADGLHACRRPLRYEPGDTLRVDVEGVFPPVLGTAELVLDRFLGGGFAGQVYRARLRRLAPASNAPIPGLVEGGTYAVKILVPPGRGARRFRDAVYWLAFQSSFSAQVNQAACRSGLLWQKIFRRAAEERFGRATAVKDVYASFHDPVLGAWGEITEWVEGRTWRLESDPALCGRRRWRTTDPEATGSPEYLAKRQFMDALVQLMREMGAPEFARQYTWWTMKSQPNVLKRTDVDEPGPSGGLCAIDFRAGLALLPFFPMSPADVKLIFEGLVRRGALVQFDRCNMARMRAFLERAPAAFAELAPLLAAFEAEDRRYRDAMLDLTHHGLRLATDRALRRSVRDGLIEGYGAADLVDAAFAERLRMSPTRFGFFRVLGAVPLLGRPLRRLWGHRAWRRHVIAQFRSIAYLSEALKARAAAGLIDALRAGRIGEPRARRLADRPVRFLVESVTLGLLPVPPLHRALAEPAWAASRVADFFRFLRQFLTSEAFRETWFLDEIDRGVADGMLTEAEAGEIRARVRDPFIVKYLKCLGVHFATLPLTQVVSLLLGAAVAGWVLARGRGWADATVTFGGVVLFFQVFPISPGSIARGLFVVFLMVRERNLRDYVIAAPLSFVKYIGYLAFPLQMTATYPRLARFMAARWATRAVHVVPVFGEKGALFEHAIFDLFFNVPQKLGRWFAPRAERVLLGWLLLGVVLGAGFSPGCAGREDPMQALLNLWIAIVVIFVLPRALFLPLLRRPETPRPRRGAG